MSKKAIAGTSKKKAMWGGRFKQDADELMQVFSESVSFDRRLYRQDIRGSIAHARMLHKVDVLTAGEFSKIQKGLKQIQSQIEAGNFAWNIAREDVHMNIESALTESEPVGAKLHTGRSRNDQVATDMRLWVMDEIDFDLAEIRELQRALVELAEAHQDVYLPGYTHLQRGQPVSFAHHCLAYVEMFERDLTRLLDARKRMNVMPLGSGALAGSTLPLDRKMVADELGFASISQNSLDAVSDRDFVVEYVFVASLAMVHLSRLAEDLILWSSAEFSFVRIGDAYTTGSSLMPQKKNPDVPELIRGKTGRVVGDLMSLLTLIKGLPMTYNRDLQEDKERLFDAADTLLASVQIMTSMLRQTEVQSETCQKAAEDPALLATDLADALVLRGIPFRKAHEIVGSGVALAEERGCTLDVLTLKDWQQFESKIRKEDMHVFNLEKAMKRRKAIGSPGPVQVKSQIKKWMKKLKDKE
ncbi:MAG: argininosuccinate lyase [Verrucomicrobiota bacterium]